MSSHTKKVSADGGLRALVVLVAAASVSMMIASSVILLTSGADTAHLTGDVTWDLIATVVYLPHITAGAFLALRLPRHPIGWLVLVPSFGFVLQSLAGRAIHYTHVVRGDPTPLTEVLAVVGDALWIPTVALGLIGLLVLYPDGRPQTRWARWVLATMGVVATAYMMITLFARAPLYYLETVPNPLGIFGDPVLFEVGQSAGFLVMFFVGLPTGITALVLRWRRAEHQEREQIKWLLWAAVIYVLGIVGSIIGSEVVEGPVQGGWTGALSDLAGVMFPIAIVIAITRYRLYEIDRIVSRTVSYAIIALVLATVYVGGVLAVQLILPDADAVAVAATTMAAAALFNPLRRRVQTAVDRRFNRSQYDARVTIDAFSQRLRDELDLDEVKSDLKQVARNTMQPETVAMWIRENP
jgi:hypothetical protein